MDLRTKFNNNKNNFYFTSEDCRAFIILYRLQCQHFITCIFGDVVNFEVLWLVYHLIVSSPKIVLLWSLLFTALLYIMEDFIQYQYKSPLQQRKTKNLGSRCYVFDRNEPTHRLLLNKNAYQHCVTRYSKLRRWLLWMHRSNFPFMRGGVQI